MVLDARNPVNDAAPIRALLEHAAARLSAVSETPRLDAEILLARALDLPRSYLFAHPDERPDEVTILRFERSVGRRLDEVPVAYETGEKEFWSMPLTVTSDTLVPRPETETLVEQALARIPREAACRVADLGTGSGAVALAIALERPLASVCATDISVAALAVAAENARRRNLPNVEFRSGSWVEPLRGGRFEVVVSNPPYVAEGDPRLAKLRHEPPVALVAGTDGLDAIRELAATVPDILAPGGVLLLEHGADQSGPVTDILGACGWIEIRTTPDFAGLPRVTAAAMQVAT